MFNRLKIMKLGLKMGVREKLLVPIVATLIVVIAGLSIALVTVQQRLNTSMQADVQQTLESANTQIGNDLEKLKSDIGQSLADMSAASSAELTRSTTKALQKQKFRIEYDWEAMMRESGESIALLMARVAPTAIIAKDFQALNSFVKAALQNPNVVYAFYFRNDGGLMTRFFDREHPKVKTYLQAAGKNRYNKILAGAKNDASIMIVDKNIQFDGDVIGSVQVGIDKSAVTDKIAEMSDRFSDLVASNQDLVATVLQTEAGKVQEHADTTVGSIIESSQIAANDTSAKLQEASAAMIRRTEQVNIIGGIICVALVAGILFVIVQQVIKPLKQTLVVVKDIAEGEGDLTKRLAVTSRDEVGELSRWFNVFLDKLQGIVGDIAGTAGALGTSSDALAGLSGKLSEGAQHMSGMSSTVASAAEEMSANMNSVAGSSDEAATNVNMVSTAAEEMTATINEIAMNSEKARTISEAAVSQAGEASTRMAQLEQAAQSIGKVTQTITEISDQTNLLALNATIEAARAGDVGKGFAVVANEIKELANQTASATQEIRNQIEGIQGSTSDTIVQIEKISQVINSVNEIVGTIATAVEEQSVTTKEIAGNVAQASQGIQDVNENVSQSSVVSGEIAKEIAGVNEVSTELSSNSSQVNQSADELHQLAGQLNELVGRFKYENA
jgi:methyl-accepting chemotaxis protein